MAVIWATVCAEIVVDEEVLEEYDGDISQWVLDDITIDNIDGECLEYQVVDVDVEF